MNYDLSKMKYEFKYVVPDELRAELRKRITPFLVHDHYMDIGDVHEGSAQAGYTVRSIYYDSPQFSCYSEKEDGLKERKKVRLRGYTTYDPASVVYLEIKRKNEKKIFKNRAAIRFCDVERFYDTGDVESCVIPGDNPQRDYDDARRYLYQIKREHYRPAVLVVYDREAYFGKFDNSLRITFDKNLRSSYRPALGDLFRDEGLRHSAIGYFVLEVKCYDTIPSWMRTLIASMGLRLQSFSKYTTCLDEHRNHRAMPNTCCFNGFVPSRTVM